MYIAIRKESDGRLYMDKYFFTRYCDKDLARYNYTKVEVPEDIFHFVIVDDFDDNLTFNQYKFDNRIKREEDISQCEKFKARLNEIQTMKESRIYLTIDQETL